MNAWAPPQTLIDAERCRTVTIWPAVNIEDMLWGLFKVAERRFDERPHDYHRWQIAAARYDAYQELAAGRVTWH